MNRDETTICEVYRGLANRGYSPEIFLDKLKDEIDFDLKGLTKEAYGVNEALRRYIDQETHLYIQRQNPNIEYDKERKFFVGLGLEEYRAARKRVISALVIHAHHHLKNREEADRAGRGIPNFRRSLAHYLQ